MDWNPHGYHNVTVAEHIISLLLNQNDNRNISYLNTFSLLSELLFVFLQPQVHLEVTVATEGKEKHKGDTRGTGRGKLSR